jgi:hypothetical protein
VRRVRRTGTGATFNDLIAHARRFGCSLEDEQEWLTAARRAISA